VAYGPDLAANVRVHVPAVDAVIDAAGAGILGAAVDLAGGPGRVITLSDPHAADFGVRLSGPDGPRLLVSNEGTLVRAERAPLRAAPPLRAPFHALAGFALGAGLWLTGRSSSRGARLGFGLASAAVGLLLGLLGVWVLLLLGTHVHAATHDNFNVLVCPPLALLLVVPGVKVALGRASGAPRLLRYARSTAVVSALGLLLATAMGQQSLRVALLCLPLLSGLWLGARAAARTT
jgi:hypothetical protein